MKSSDWQILHKLYKTPNITKVANSLYVTQMSHGSLLAKSRDIPAVFCRKTLKTPKKLKDFIRYIEDNEGMVSNDKIVQ